MSNIVLILTGTLGMMAFGIIGGFILLGVDRKIAAHMQARVGPRLRQPYWDFLKLLCKENVIPDNAIVWLYNAAPLVALASAATILLYLPVAGFAPILEGKGDLILVMYLLVVPALAMVAGGFASGSPYATIGAQREMVTMIAYELPLATTVVAFAWKMTQMGLAMPFSLETITANPILGMVGPVGVVGVFMLFMAMVLVTPGELSKVPFDAPEAKSELADGLLVEYSGRNLGMYYLTLGTKMVVMATLTTALFIPYGISGWLGLSGIAAHAVDIVFFVIKVLFITFVSMTLIRVVSARFRINQVVTVYWKYGGLLSIIGLLLLMLDARM